MYNIQIENLGCYITLLYHYVNKSLCNIVENIPVTIDGRELYLLVRLVQRAGRWFSLSLALGIDDVADI